MKPSQTSDAPCKIAICCHSTARLDEAKALSSQTGIPLVSGKTADFDMLLQFYPDRVELFDLSLKTKLLIDFTSGQLAHRQQFGGGRGQAIAKAAGLKGGKTPTVLDVTAGLGGDAFVLASLGCPLILVERSPVLHCLLADAIARAGLSESFQPILKQGFELVHADARDYMQQQIRQEATPPDVIYIDPMYPERKKSALVKKDMQILQRMHGADDNAAELLETALLFADKRVVVKRPLHAPELNKRKPNTRVSSKKTRYDIYTLKKM